MISKFNENKYRTREGSHTRFVFLGALPVFFNVFVIVLSFTFQYSNAVSAVLFNQYKKKLHENNDELTTKKILTKIIRLLFSILHKISFESK